MRTNRSQPLLLLAALAGALAFTAPLQAAAPAPPPAQKLLRTAEVQAQAAHKNVLVIFGASWCGWCHMLDNFMKTAKPVFAHNFVVVNLDVDESREKAGLENPGGRKLLKKWEGDGFPFLVILSPSGKLIVSSNRKGKANANVGFPVKPDEQAWFRTMMQKGAPGLAPAALDRFAQQLAAFDRQHKLH